MSEARGRAPVAAGVAAPVGDVVATVRGQAAATVAASVGTLVAVLGLLALAPAVASEDMVRIDGGSYLLGDDAGASDERPAHRLTLEPFLIDRHEVTNADYVAFMRGWDVTLRRDVEPGALRRGDAAGADADRLFERDRGPDRRLYIALDDDDVRIGVQAGQFAPQPGYERHPVNEVTWAGAVAYCRWRDARLPTEAEWEAAARGTQGRRYPWGDAAPTPQRAVYGRRSGGTEPVGSLPQGATPEGVVDLAGNVAEWTRSLYRPYPYRADDGREDPAAAGERVTRGGDHVFDASPDKMRATFRSGFSRAPDAGHRHIGFRCARSVR